MSWMFAGCKSLKKLDLSSWDVSNVTDMSYMFDGCKAKILLDMSAWDASDAVDFDGMSLGCRPLHLLDVSTGAIPVEMLRLSSRGDEHDD